MPPQHERRGRSGEADRPPARKRWGQHFLARPEIAERIVDAARVSPDDLVLEIGPGDGALTRPLARRAGRVVAVEIDPLRAERLRAELGEDARVAVWTGDVMQRTFREWLDAAGAKGAAVLVANLPYNAATRILTAAVEDPSTIRRAVATVQAEVADRFLARPGDDAYGYLSVRTAAHATGRRLFDLPPSAFRPRPKVHSTVMELTPRPHPVADADAIRGALRLASLGFHARRKTLANALSSVSPRGHWERLLESIGKTPRARAEELSLDDFLALAQEPVRG
jgi:16S rRNA (adenine1518-N6/adenine1519-N6)-dimethyltransferase